MDDEWEDFLGLDDKPTSNVVLTDNDNEEDDENTFTLPEQIGPLNPSVEEKTKADDQHVENPSPTTINNTEDNSFDMDFLSVNEDTTPPSVQSTDVIQNTMDTDTTANDMDFLSVDDTPHHESVPSPIDNANNDHLSTENEDAERTSSPTNDPNTTSEQEMSSSTPTPSPDEFMSWLDDKKTSSENKPAVEESSTPNTKLMMDSFFDEVFGDDESNPLSAKPVASSKSFESQIRKEISSAFCDVNKIRNLILGAGYLPKTVRGQVRHDTHITSEQMHCMVAYVFAQLLSICVYTRRTSMS